MVKIAEGLIVHTHECVVEDRWKGEGVGKGEKGNWKITAKWKMCKDKILL